jgi:hypothetical protein
MYLALSRGASVVHFRDMWVAKLPLKIRIFNWKLALNRLPTREALTHRRGHQMGGVRSAVKHNLLVTSSSTALWRSLDGVWFARCWVADGVPPPFHNSFTFSQPLLADLVVLFGLFLLPYVVLFGKCATDTFFRLR